MKKRDAIWLRERILWCFVLTAISMFFAMLFVQLGNPLMADANVAGNAPEVHIERWVFGGDK